MSMLKNRVIKLESNQCQAINFHILRFIVDPFKAPIGYRCGEVEIIRRHDESKDQFINRCDQSMVWPSQTYRHIFDPVLESHS
jgi:hypothetical protein